MTQLIEKFAAVLAANRSMTANQLAEELKCTQPHARLLLGRLHRARQIHIREWHRAAKTGKYAPVYMWGDALDAPMPLRVQEAITQQAETQSYATIACLRTSYSPGMFDPFRVLRAQVGL